MTQSAIEEAVDDILTAFSGPDATESAELTGSWLALWHKLSELGFTHATLPEHAGGGDLEFREASCLLRLAGRHSAFVPLAETAFLGGWLLSSAGLAVPAGPVTSGPVSRHDSVTADRVGDEWQLSGVAEIPWASAADRIAVLARTESGYLVVSVDPALAVISPASNLAGEPRDSVDFTGVRLGLDDAASVSDALACTHWKRGGLTRTLLTQGAMEAALNLSVRFAGQREQFGRPIASFQAVAQHLALMAREVELSRVAVDLAVSRTTHGYDDDNGLEVAAARVRACAAAAVVARLSHQVHGAIGVTREYPLQLLTRRLWSWRDEFGTETEWAYEMSRELAKSELGLWAHLTARTGVNTVGGAA